MWGKICKQNVEGMAWLLLSAYSKMQEERNELKIEFIIKKNADLKDLKKSHSMKKEKTGSGENIKDVAKQSFDKEISMDRRKPDGIHQDNGKMTADYFGDLHDFPLCQWPRIPGPWGRLISTLLTEIHGCTPCCFNCGSSGLKCNSDQCSGGHRL